MGHLTCLTDPTAAIVLDTSVVINLGASGYAQEIVAAFSGRVVVPKGVEAEIVGSGTRGLPLARLLKTLQSSGLLRVDDLNEAGGATFESLVSGSAAETLDDGEAATIAYATQHGEIAVIDERKANRICAERFPGLRTVCSVEVFMHLQARNALTKAQLEAAVHSALVNARMTVFPHHATWVVDLIGPERARSCTSLPRVIRGAQKSEP